MKKKEWFQNLLFKCNLYRYNMAPVNRVVSGIFGAADTDTKFTRGLAVCALTAVHVAVSGALLQASGGSVATALGCLVVLCVLLAAQVAVLLGGTGTLVFKRLEMEQVDGKAQQAVKAAQEGVGPVALLSLLDFWLLFVALMLSLGAGVTVINNLSQMVGAFESLAPTAGVVSHSLLKLLACTNTLGRLASGRAVALTPLPGVTSITRTPYRPSYQSNRVLTHNNNVT
jgi:hypothetical protein